ncbi:putative aminopeptidase [Pseudoduganella flava]|uniref:Aminopeptidase n=1 Tax=Pseudoduganella flava TaxID=871742 RepID=A0A562PD52_9BURK|nr:aminopeptidase [Pseudoduganella flava]QGZ40110.1 aminopeptidase [Pseudoduganella flava]TWI42140.1 putative aminopeptidase [Pseudoduganella flava]
MRKIARLKIRARYLVAGLSCAAMLAGCAQMKYYFQAAQGQYSLWSDSRPIDDWLGDPATDAKLRARLEKAVTIRKFAVKELGLPDNASYKNYASLNRPFVLWNVVATPELSLRPIQWCFPIAGCVAYRGYYDKEDALAYAEELRAEGDDVQVGGVPAYSTLGWFSDPLLSTFINYSDAELARMVFHELAHQVVYVPGDSRFNEAFASAVEEAGVDRWLDLYGNDAMREAYARYSMRRKDFMALLVRHRQMLSDLYASKVSVKKKREEKARIFASLHSEYKVLKANWGGYSGYDRFFAEKLTNAHLAAVATYNDLLPGFKALLAQEKTFPRFYAAVQRISNLPSVERQERLAQLARSAEPPAVSLVAEKRPDTAGGH